MTNGNRPIFIRDQGIEILVGDQIDLQYHLHPSRFRGSADKDVQSGMAGAVGSEGRWVSLAQTMSQDNADAAARAIMDADALLVRLDPALAAARSLLLEQHQTLHRTVLVADSGYGKTVRLRWIRYELSRQRSRLIPVLLNVDQLPGSDAHLLEILQRQLSEANQPFELRTIDRWRKSGRILLLLDAADQIRELETLTKLLKDPLWQRCPIVIAGRPEVIHTHRDTFSKVNSQFVRPTELTNDQLQGYTGSERFSQLEHLEDGLEILRNPRVAWYLGYVIETPKLKQLRTASDVFESATGHLLLQGLRNPEAWRLGLACSLQERTERTTPPPAFQPNPDSQVERAHRLLSAIAFEQMLLPPEFTAVEGHPPNFSGVNCDELPEFRTKVFERIRHHDSRYFDKLIGRDLFDVDLQCLSAANAAITRGLLDVEPLWREIRWRNKSLQEFYAARWLSNHATEEDLRYLTARRYHPLIKDTFWFYWVERYLCEMPRRAGEQKRWAYAVEPFFRPGDGTVAGTHRSCEMIFRAWPRLDELATRPNRHETVVRNAFLGEFETSILSGARDANWHASGKRALQPSAAAKELQESFVDIPAGRFHMGAPDDRQGMGTQLRQRWEEKIKNFSTLDAFLEDRMQMYKEYSRTDAQLIQFYRKQWTAVFNQGVQYLENWAFPHDETPESDCEELDIAAFQLSRYPTLNRWYRLFDPGHGADGSPYQDYKAISGSEDRPVIYVDWYMSWCFALFCHWDGQSCELPGEDQWEYAAKAEKSVVTRPADYQDFWWGDDFEKGRHHCTSHATATSPPASFTRSKAGDQHHENPFGLVDMLGNVWEWTRDRYRERYSRTATDGRSSAFVLRGGAWYCNVPTLLRCGRRSYFLPTNSDHYTGCRLSRVARARKP